MVEEEKVIEVLKTLCDYAERAKNTDLSGVFCPTIIKANYANGLRDAYITIIEQLYDGDGSDLPRFPLVTL